MGKDRRGRAHQTAPTKMGTALDGPLPILHFVQFCYGKDL